MPKTHTHNGVICGYPTKKACDLARKVALGQCSEMIEAKGEPHPCPHWAVEKVADKGYCGQHLGSVIRAEFERDRTERLREELNARIAEYIDWRAEHPSVWDRMGSVSR